MSQDTLHFQLFPILYQGKQDGAVVCRILTDDLFCCIGAQTVSVSSYASPNGQC